MVYTQTGLDLLNHATKFCLSKKLYLDDNFVAEFVVIWFYPVYLYNNNASNKPGGTMQKSEVNKQNFRSRIGCRMSDQMLDWMTDRMTDRIG